MTASPASRQTTLPDLVERRRTIPYLVREWDTAVTVRDLFHEARAEAERQVDAGRVLGHRRILPDLEAAAGAAEQAAMGVAEAIKRAKPRSLVDVADKLRVVTACYGDEEDRIRETGLWDDVLVELRTVAAGDAIRLVD